MANDAGFYRWVVGNQEWQAATKEDMMAKAKKSKRRYRCFLCKKKKNRCAGVLCTRCYIIVTGEFPPKEK